jgi:hypothetical protein
MFYYGNNVGMNSPFTANGQINTFGGVQRNMYGPYNPAMNTPVQDTYKPSVPAKSKKKKSHTAEILAGIALGIAALVGVYKGHDKIANVVKKVATRKAAYQASHANMNKKGALEACKKVGKSVLDMGKSIFNIPKTMVKETHTFFKNTAK